MTLDDKFFYDKENNNVISNYNNEKDKKNSIINIYSYNHNYNNKNKFNYKLLYNKNLINLSKGLKDDFPRVRLLDEKWHLHHKFPLKKIL